MIGIKSPQGNSVQLPFDIPHIFQKQKYCSVSEIDTAVPASSMQPGSTAASRCAAGGLQLPKLSGITAVHHILLLHYRGVTWY